MTLPRTVREPYLVRSVLHASEVLGAFQSSIETLRLCDVVQRTGFSKGMCFRLLHTLHYCGMVEKVDANRYRLTLEMRRRRRYRIGYAAQGGIVRQDVGEIAPADGALIRDRRRDRNGADRDRIGNHDRLG